MGKIKGIIQHTLIVSILAILLWMPVFSFARDIKFSRISVENGLPSNVVYAITQDKTGFIWFGTKEGLARYDGHNIVRIPLPEENFDEVSKQRINCLCEDEDHNLWIGTSYGILRFNQETETFKHYIFDENNRLDLSRFVNSIVLRNDGSLWAGTRNGIFYFDKGKDQFVVYPHFAHHSEFQSMTKGERIVKKLHFDRLGFLWVGTEGNGISRLNLNEHSKVTYLNDPLNTNTLCSNFVETIFEDSYGILWIGTTFGIARFDRENEIFQSFQKGDHETGLSDNIVSSLMEDNMGNLYMGTRNGLDLMLRKERKIIHFLHHPDNNQSISSNNITCSYRDRTGAYWIGTIQGISQFSYRSHQFELFQSIPENPNSLNNNTLRTISSDNHQNIWVGTQNDGMNRYNHASGNFRHYLSAQNGQNHIHSSLWTQSGEFFIGTDAGLLKYNESSDRFEIHDFDGKFTYTNKGIYEVKEDQSGNLYFSELDRGLFCYRKDKREIEEIKLQLSGLDDSKAKNIKVLYFDKQGDLWCSLHMGGIARLNLQTGETTHWQQGNNGLQSNMVWDIYENKHGIWLGTENGLHLYSSKTNSFKQFSIREGLPGALVVSILEDDNNRLWLGTNKGLSCFDPQQGTFINYSGAEGLQGEIFEYKVKLKIGKLLLFGGNNGLNVFNPNEFDQNNYTPQPCFTNLNISKHAVKADEEVGTHTPLEKSIIFSDEIELKDSYRDIEIEFSAFSYIQSKKNIYKYCFLGTKDTCWYFTEDNHNSVYFPKLKAGKYRLKVMAANCDGKWSNKPIEMEIKVSRDFRKIAGYVSNIFLGVIIIFMLFYFRKSLKKAISDLNRNTKKADTGEELRPKFRLDPNLDPRIKKELQALIDCMDKEHLYLDKRISKIQLAAHLKISLATLSSLLRDHLDVGFNDFINYYRVEAVKRMMKDPKNRDFTLLSISEDCGFNSKTSFYRIFKNFTGLTPAEYHEKYVVSVQQRPTNIN